MGAKKTPIIQKLRNTGGTLYVFPSASEDIGLNLQAGTSGVAMSHYALLNLPTMNKITLTGTDTSKPSELLARSLQNYAMNFETVLINQPDYNYQAMSTVSERVFWHWMQKYNLIGTFNNLSDNTYEEPGRDTDKNIKDQTVVKCFGSIDAGNSLSTEFGMFNETYINIPSSYGAGPVFFKVNSDSNFAINKTYTPTNKNYLEGREDSTTYQLYVDEATPKYDLDNSKYVVTTNDAFEIIKDIPTIQTCLRNKYGDNSIVVSSYDDINIDTPDKFSVDTEFDFNAILLYYSVYDQDDIIKTSYATNLFGIIFLDGPVDNGDGTFYIPPIVKRKSTSDHFGTSFSFRVNLKTMSVFDNTEAIIQDNTTLSSIASVEFGDVISNLNRAIDTLNANTTVISNIQDKYASILAFYDNLESKINTIDDNLKNMKVASLLKENEELKKRIEALEKKLNQ